MKTAILIVAVMCGAGCTRAFWNPETDKAVSQRKQVELMERQAVALERIAAAVEAEGG